MLAIIPMRETKSRVCPTKEVCQPVNREHPLLVPTGYVTSKVTFWGWGSGEGESTTSLKWL